MVLAFAIRTNRIVLTMNRRDFVRLHNQNPQHPGIIACTDDSDREAIALRIQDAIATLDSLTGLLIRVNRPN